MRSIEGNTGEEARESKEEFIARLTKLRLEMHNAIGHGDTYNDNYFQMFNQSVKEFKRRAYEAVGEEHVWDYLAYHILWGSTPDVENTPYCDMPGELSVEAFCRSFLDKLSTSENAVNNHNAQDIHT